MDEKDEQYYKHIEQVRHWLHIRTEEAFQDEFGINIWERDPSKWIVDDMSSYLRRQIHFWTRPNIREEDDPRNMAYCSRTAHKILEVADKYGIREELEQYYLQRIRTQTGSAMVACMEDIELLEKYYPNGKATLPREWLEQAGRR